ncbi:GGDEF domain-containing protein [Actinokineospora enzanensis]|uniref:GGDEF domain-containing protein n=1 Tax=Actinokineospora enzanensis TaxID=155975 RepID=UPI00036006FE|nr:GGDEF domain-containing protein [Actinokineospora enzanensis]
MAGSGLWRKPRWAIVWLLAIDVLVAVWAATASFMGHDTLGWPVLLRFVVFAGCATAHLVGTREPEERRRDADRRTEHVDQTSIWFFGAALVLPVPLVLALVGLVRVQRYLIARKPLHTFVFTSASIAASALGVHALSAATPLRAWLTGERDLPREPTMDMLIAVGALSGAVAIYFLAQALLVGVARGLITGRWSLSNLLGDRRTNLFILTTLFMAVCAGVLQAFVVVLVLVMVPIAVRSTRVEQQLKQKTADAEHDSKTELLNDRGFSPAAAVQLYGDQLAGRPSALLFCDIDLFKEWNDRLGHIGADQVLGALAKVLRTTVRDSDLVCRWGGEEFLVLLPGTAADEAVEIAERIRLRFATMALTVKKPAGGQEVTLNADERDGDGFTISIGIAVSPDHGTELEAIKEVANQAMKTAKDEGRNQVVLAPVAPHRAVTPVG